MRSLYPCKGEPPGRGVALLPMIVNFTNYPELLVLASVFRVASTATDSEDDVQALNTLYQPAGYFVQKAEEKVVGAIDDF